MWNPILLPFCSVSFSLSVSQQLRQTHFLIDTRVLCFHPFSISRLSRGSPCLDRARTSSLTHSSPRPLRPFSAIHSFTAEETTVHASLFHHHNKLATIFLIHPPPIRHQHRVVHVTKAQLRCVLTFLISTQQTYSSLQIIPQCDQFKSWPRWLPFPPFHPRGPSTSMAARLWKA
jgi:hypothetical protein